MAKISTDEVAHIAHLARIALTAEETKQIATELAAILGYVEKLNAVDTRDIAITAQVTGLKSIWRKDVVKPSINKEDLALNAPQMKGSYIKAKKVL